MKFALLIMSGFILSGCATGYHPAGFSGGYSETKYSSDTVKISFQGNGYTSASRVQDYALLRAADYTVERGYEYFYILNSSGERSNSLVQTSPGQIQFNNYSNSATYYNPTYMNVSKASEGILIKLSHDNGNGAINALDMRRTLSESLGVALEEVPYKFQREPSNTPDLPSAINPEEKTDDGSDYWSKPPVK